MIPSLRPIVLMKRTALTTNVSKSYVATAMILYIKLK